MSNGAERQRAALYATLRRLLSRYLTRPEFLAIMAYGTHPSHLRRTTGIELLPEQLTLALFNLERARVRGSASAGRRVFQAIVERRVMESACECELHPFLDARIALVYYGDATNRLLLISGSVQEFNDRFGDVALNDVAITYSVASPLEAAYALVPFNRFLGGELRSNPTDIIPDLAEMLYAIVARRLWVDDIRDLLVQVAIETQDFRWGSWDDIAHLPFAERIPNAVRALDPDAVRGILQLPEEEWEGYVGDLLRYLVQQDLDELLQLSHQAFRDGKITANRERHLALYALNYLIAADGLDDI